MPSAYLFFLAKIKYPETPPKFPQPKKHPGKLKIAVITLCVPSKESLETIERQLSALSKLQEDYNFSLDRWILDEENNSKVQELAKRYGTLYFSRKGVRKYNQEKPPFQAKTKAGNVNAWLNFVGHQYDFFVQFDIDHNPVPEYVKKVLPYFSDPKVAYIQAPSVYKNLESWTARGAAEQELVFQGPLQMGFFGWSGNPFIIGSHTTYRTSAVLEINGFQPTRAEDHMDTVVLAGEVYKGIFHPEVIATGDGPENLATYCAQQFAWAYSMSQILLFHAPKLFKKWTWKQRFQFLFSETWYPLWSISMATLFLLPVISLLSEVPIAQMSFLEFAPRFFLLNFWPLLVWKWSKKWFPVKLNLSWKGILLHVARWPFVVLAFFSALLKIKKPYMITPKGNKESKITFGQVKIFFFLVISSLVAVGVKINSKPQVLGNLIYILEGGALFLLLVTITTFKSKSEKRLWVTLPILWLSLITLTYHSFPKIAASLTWTVPTTKPSATTATQDFQYQLTPELKFENPTVSSAQFQQNRETPTKEETKKQEETPIPTPTKTPSPTPTPRIVSYPSGFAWGIYNSNNQLPSLPFGLGMMYINWVDPQAGEKIVAFTQECKEKNIFPVITIEPYPTDPETHSLLTDITEGKYDQNINTIAQALLSQNQPVLLRWGHEMEMVNLYPWSTPDPEKYIKAYQYVQRKLRNALGEKVKFIWSPAGNENAPNYYPGDDFCDFIGITILGDPLWDKWAGFSQMRNFETLLREKYNSLSQYNKPIIIAELGVSGSPEEKEKWLMEAKETIKNFPLVKGCIYFNSKNYHETGGYIPDWSVEKKVFENLLN